MISFLALFGVFFKIGMFTFGGGQAMIPLLQKDLVVNLAWVPMKEFLDFVAISEITPGPVAINMATFVGYKAGGLLGALLGTIAVFFPSFVVLTTLVPYYDRIKRSRPIQVMVRGVLAAFLGMLLLVAYHFAREALVDWKTWALMGAAWLALWRKVDLLLIVGVGAALSMLVF